MIYKPINPFIYFPRLGSDSKLIEDAWKRVNNSRSIIESEKARQSLNGRGSNASEITLRTFVACIAKGLSATAIRVPRIRR